MKRCPFMTTEAGIPIADNQCSLTAGPCDSVLMADYQLNSYRTCITKLG